MTMFDFLLSPSVVQKGHSLKKYIDMSIQITEIIYNGTFKPTGARFFICIMVLTLYINLSTIEINNIVHNSTLRACSFSWTIAEIDFSLLNYKILYMCNRVAYVSKVVVYIIVLSWQQFS